MALYFYFNETTGNLVYSDKATYDVEGYASLGEQTNLNPDLSTNWVFHSKRSAIKTVSKDSAVVGKIAGLTSMNNMFYNCGNLTNIDLSGFDTSAVTNMYGMFQNCSNLTSLDLSGFDMSAATNMSYMFYRCYNLTSLDLSGLDTSAVTLISNMFASCTSLRLITISDKMSNALPELPADQYYPTAGGAPVAKADLTAGTWVRDEADLTKVTSLVQQAQMSQAISRRIGGVRRDLDATTADVKELQDSLSQFSFNLSIPNLSADISPSALPDGIRMYVILDDGVLSDQPTPSGFLITFSHMGQMREYLFALDSSDIYMRYANSSEAAWSSWYFFNTTIRHSPIPPVPS